MARATAQAAREAAVVVMAIALALGVGTRAVAAEDAVKLGKELYVERCVLCHGSEGHGWEWSQKVMKPPVPVKSLVETVPSRDDRFLKTIILDGGEAVGQTPFMPAFRFRMSEGEAAAIVAYLRSISGARSR